MRKFLLCIAFSFFGVLSFGQNLEGEWKGFLEVEGFESLPRYITEQKLFFRLEADGNYSVYGYCRGKRKNGADTIVVTRIHITRGQEDSIFLTEIEILKPRDIIDNCLIGMRLKISGNNDNVTLKGTWNCKNEYNGTITFRRKEL